MKRAVCDGWERGKEPQVRLYLSGAIQEPRNTFNSPCSLDLCVSSFSASIENTEPEGTEIDTGVSYVSTSVSFASTEFDTKR